MLWYSIVVGRVKYMFPFDVMCMCYSHLCITRALFLQEVVICILVAAPTLTLPIQTLKQSSGEENPRE